MKESMVPTSVEGIAQYVEVEQRMAKLLPMFVKFKKRAAEKDKDKQLYGPETLKKVKALIEEYENIDEAFQDQLTPKFENWKRKQILKVFENLIKSCENHTKS